MELGRLIRAGISEREMRRERKAATKTVSHSRQMSAVKTTAEV